jgi:hypothetical protein
LNGLGKREIKVSTQSSSSSDSAGKPAAIPNNLWRLASAAQNLNQLSDRLSEQVAELENGINKLNLGVRATVDVEASAVDNLVVLCLRLGYDKVGGQWGFCIDRFIESDPEDTYEKWSFKDAPRDLRLKVVDRFPQLLDEMVNTSLKLASEINDKISLAKGLVSLLPQPSPTGSKK